VQAADGKRVELPSAIFRFEKFLAYAPVEGVLESAGNGE